ncbi:MAG: GAF domain-containing protein [Planctomycetes bacterium]|nr:GAF domain-containing protein [Planctomycetota bacterium]
MADEELDDLPSTLETTASDDQSSTLERLDRCIRRLHQANSLEDLIGALERRAKKLMRCEHALCFRVEGEGKLMRLLGTRKAGREQVSVPVGRGIAGTVAGEEGYYLCNDPASDALYLKAIDGLPGVEVRNLASVAMMTEEGPVGVLQVWNKKKGRFEENDAFLMQQMADHAALAYARLKRSEDGWGLARDLAQALASAVDDKHVSTVGHSDRTRQVAVALGKAFELSTDELLELEFAALLHDIGRLALSPEAFEWTGGPGHAAKAYAVEGEQLHVVLTEAVLRDLRLPKYLKRIPELVLQHHERTDGTGFPKKLKKADLSLSARILAVANAWDLLTGGRAAVCNGKRLSDEEAAKHLQAEAGKAYDKEVVAKLLEDQLYRIDKRRYPRYDYEVPLEVTVLGESGEKAKQSETFETQALELSEGGILFRSAQRLPDQGLLRLRIDLPSETLDALARVARQLPGDGGQGVKVGAYFLWYGSQG